MARFAGRPLDRVYFWFFTFHITIYPSWLIDGTPLQDFLKWYLSWSRDPIMIGGLTGGSEWDWIRPFFVLEGTLQLFCFFIGAYGFWTNDKRIYPLMLFYGASTATTMAPVLFALYKDTSVPPLSQFEMANILCTYIPFLLIPLGIAIDMGVRLSSIINQLPTRKTE